MFSSGAAFVLFKGLIGFGLPIAFGFHQLWLLKRDERTTPSNPTGEPASDVKGEPPRAVANEDHPAGLREVA